MNQRYWKNKYHASVNVSLMVANTAQIKSGIMLNVNVNVNPITHVNKTIVGILIHVSVRMINIYLESIIDDSVIRGDEIIYTIDSVSATVTSILLTHFCNKKIRSKMDCYSLHTDFLVLISLLIIAITRYHYAKDRSKRKNALLH